MVSANRPPAGGGLAFWLWAFSGAAADGASWVEFLGHKQKGIGYLMTLPMYALLAWVTFLGSLRTRFAGRVLVRIQDVGFFSNYLAVLDVCARVAPGSEVVVDWVLTGDEVHFTYGSKGDNVWSLLFEEATIEGIRIRGRTPADRDASFVSMPKLPVLGFFRYHSYFTADMKAFWGGDGVAAFAASYNRFAGRIPVGNAYVQEAVAAVGGLESAGATGVHKRVNNFASLYQQGGRYSLENDAYVVAVRKHESKGPIYLASDDADAPAAFARAFGGRVRVRDGVTRVPAGFEVHMKEMNEKPATIKEACDVYVDAALLAKCDHLIGGASAVSLAVRFMNPRITMEYVQT